jgi:hypothetical protein
VIARADEGRTPRTTQSATRNKSCLMRIPSPLSGLYVQPSPDQKASRDDSTYP